MTQRPLIATTALLACATLAHAQNATDLATKRTLSAHDLGAFTSEPNIEAGIVGGPEDCVTAIDCAQPGDFTMFINASFFDAAEIMEFAQDGALTRICTTFVFAGGSCAGSPEDPSYTSDWTWDFFPVDSQGVPSGASIGHFNTEFPLANMTAELLFIGAIGAGFPVFYSSFTLHAPGQPVANGQCLAMQPKFNLAGCSAFWETSSNEDDSLTGDGLSLQDSLMDGYDTCDYTQNDLLLCLDVLTAQPPSCTLNVDLGAPSNDNCEGASSFPLICDATTTQCLLFASRNTQDDPALPCAQGEPNGFTGDVTVWYEFTPTSSRAILSMCRVSDGMGGGGNAPFPNGDFILAVYEPAATPGAGEGPCDLVQIACSDDNCRQNKPYLCLNDLDPMQTYLVEIAAHNDSDGVQIELDVTCDPMSIPPVPANDDCIDAEVLTFPFIDEFAPSDATNSMGENASGNTRCATLDPIAGSCGGTTNGNSPGVWYTFMGTGMDVLITGCTDGVDYDSQINVYCGSCSTGLVCLAGNDDAMPGFGCAPFSELTICTEVGRQYYLYVHGNNDVGNFSLTVRNNPDLQGFCTNDPPHADLCLLCECECTFVNGSAPDIDEMTSAAALMEMCGTDVNGGCAIDPNSGTAFIEAGAAPFTACANIFADSGVRDLDEYRFTLANRSILSIRMLSEFAPEFTLFDSDDCATRVAIVNESGVAGTSLSALAVLDAGTYVLRCTSSSTNGAPCGITNSYLLDVGAEPFGRCCIFDGPTFDDCCVTTEANCNDLGGQFDPGASCGTYTYDIDDSMSVLPFNSVINEPNAIILTGDTGNPGFEDNDSQRLIIAGPGSQLLTMSGAQGEFPFRLYGECVTSVTVYAHGYITLNQVGARTVDGEPNLIPADDNINGLLAPLWSFLSTRFETTLAVHLAGSMPFRTLTIEYNMIDRANAPGDPQTFQIMLFEGSDDIRFLYNAIDPPLITDPMNPEYTVGVESTDGTQAAALTETQIEALDTSGLAPNEAIAIGFHPVRDFTPQEPCEPIITSCPGDCDDSGDVSFNDLVAMLFQFGNTSFPANCDADNSGAIDFNDLVASLFNFGPCL